jgi:single-stranded DNA-binding protein
MNVLTVTGRLCLDPVRRDTMRGTVSEFLVDVDGNAPLYLLVECSGELASSCAEHLHAGRCVAVSGVLAFEHYVTPNLDFDVRWFCRANTVALLDTAAIKTTAETRS